MGLDGADQVRAYIETQLIRQRLALELLELGIVNKHVLGMFYTGDEDWHMVDLNPAHRN